MTQRSVESNISLIGLGVMTIITGFILLILGAGDQTGSFWTLLVVGFGTIVIGAFIGDE